jgi:hypothetical protein
MQSWKEISSRLDSLNLKKANYKSPDNHFEIPTIYKQDIKVKRLIPFGKSDKNGTAHFFLDDYAFERVWNKPDKYLNMLQQYDSVLSPDFSPYDDYPLIIQAFNVYRNRWCGRYWQDKGCLVIPTVTWSGRDSFNFAFDGIQEGSIVAISAVSLGMQKKYLKLFYEGYQILQELIKPSEVLVYSNIDLELDGNVKYIKGFALERLRNIGEDHK